MTADSTSFQENLTSADTTLALSFDSASTPWFAYPYWVAQADTLTTRTGLLQPMVERDSKLWIAGILLLSLIIIGFVRVMFQRYVRTLFKALFNLKLASQLYEEQEMTMPFSAFALNINFLITVSLFIFLLLQQFSLTPVPNAIKGFGIVLGIVSGLYLLRYLSLKVLYALFPHLEEVNFYNFHFFLLNKVAGIAVLPFLFLMSFSGDLPEMISLYTVSGILALLLLLNYARGILISKKYLQNDVFHFFLYICTLEIVPSIVVYKSFDTLFL